MNAPIAKCKGFDGISAKTIALLCEKILSIHCVAMVFGLRSSPYDSKERFTLGCRPLTAQLQNLAELSTAGEALSS